MTNQTDIDTILLYLGDTLATAGMRLVILAAAILLVRELLRELAPWALREGDHEQDRD